MRVTMIEVGHWHAERHARSLQLGDAEIVGVCDRQPGVAARFVATAQLPVDLTCPPFQDYSEMLKTTRPDFVLAMGRHADMPAIARDLISAGIPFAIEKPVGTVCACIARQGGPIETWTFFSRGNREMIVQRSVNIILYRLYRCIMQHP